MNIIETVRKILSDCPQMTMFNGGISVDYTENKENACGMYSNGDTLLKEDILGNQKRQHNFVLYASGQSYNDYDRLVNSTFLLDLAYWLDKQRGQEISGIIDGIEYKGMVKSLSTSNGMLYSVPTGNINDGVTYQIQMQAIYMIESEEL